MKTLVTAFMLVVMSASVALADHHVVKVEKKEGLGSYLVDSKGMTLYYFTKDSAGKSACTADCVSRWPLYYREKVAVKGDIKAEDFGVITREDGQKQTTYKGKPLYYFVNDKAAGDTTGQGVKGVWYVVAP